MALRPIKPALQQSEGRSKPWSGASLVNCFCEKADGDKRADFAVMATPGLTAFANIGTGPVRGAHVMGGLLYVISGEELYSVNQSGSATLIGSVPGSHVARMMDNGDEMAIAADGYGYVLSGGAIVRPVDLPQVSDVTYIDGYFVWSILNSDQCIYSAINDGTSYDLLDVFTAEGAPDGIVGIMTDHREVHLFGASTIEIFYNSGGADNAFERQGNAFIERGCFDRDSIVKIDNAITFMGDDRIIYRLDGYSPLRISTHAIEYRLRSATYARAFTYTQEGHKFYCLTVDDGTLIYDVATGAWHERRSTGMEAWRVGGAVQAWGNTYLTDANSGKLYIPSLDAYDEDGAAIRMEIGLPTLEASRERVTMYAFEAYMESGTGLNSGQGSDPQIMLQYSDDGGRTWSRELWRGMGRIGEYRRRTVWRSLGQFRQRQIKLAITDSVKRFAIGYFADVR